MAEEDIQPLVCDNGTGMVKERAHKFYDGMSKEQFKKMQEFIAGLGSKKPSSKL